MKHNQDKDNGDLKQMNELYDCLHALNANIHFHIMFYKEIMKII